MNANTVVRRRVSESEPGQVRLGRLGDAIGFRLRRVQNQLSRDFSQAISGRGLRSGLFSSLGVISANPGISQSELSQEVGLDKSVTVTIVDELESRGWAVRERSPQDRRRHALFITEAGEANLAELFDLVEETERTVLGQLTTEERRLLSELLDRMYAAFFRDEEG
jgi:DNA-binding MarR family transcriptional regulator